MKCPHCLVAFHADTIYRRLGSDADGQWFCEETMCPSCNRMIIRLVNADNYIASGVRQLTESFVTELLEIKETTFARPKGSSLAFCPPEVPAEIAEDYKEACLVLFDSPKASAALSRRCLQNLLRKAAKVKPARLYDEIQEAMVGLPSYLAEEIDDIRKFGNIAAHPTEKKSTGEIVPVEAGEAEAMLNILEGLFDFYYVQPERAKQRRKALQNKLK